ncbi:hypothetical protein Tco_0498965 [Tanacetum coccineum]
MSAKVALEVYTVVADKLDHPTVYSTVQMRSDNIFFCHLRRVLGERVSSYKSYIFDAHDVLSQNSWTISNATVDVIDAAAANSGVK